MTAPYTPGQDRSVGELFGEVSRDLSALVRQEIALAKAETTQSAKRAGTGAGLFAGAAVGTYLTLFFLSIAAWWAIGNSTGRGWSAVIVAAFWLIVAAVLAMMGRRAMAKVRGLSQTADTVKEIPDALKDTRSDHEHI
jgi:hypothetical protein